MADADLEDEPSEFELAEEASIDEPLAASSGAVRRVIEDCHEAFGHGVPTVVLGQVGMWYQEAAASPDPEDVHDAQRAAHVLSSLYESGNDSVQTIIATGFLEVLPSPCAEGREVVERLPTPLREELRRMENWTPS